MFTNYQDTDGLAYSRHCDDTNTHTHRCGLCEGVDYKAMELDVPEPETVMCDKDLPCTCDWTSELIDEYIYYYEMAKFARDI